MAKEQITAGLRRAGMADAQEIEAAVESMLGQCELKCSLDFSQAGGLADAVRTKLRHMGKEAWRALNSYVKSLHGGQGVHTIDVGHSSMSGELIACLNELDDLEHLWFKLLANRDPLAKHGPSSRTMNLLGLRSNPRLRHVHVDCSATNHYWLLLAPNTMTVSTPTRHPTVFKVKVQYTRTDGAPDGKALPLDGQQYFRQPKDFIPEGSVDSLKVTQDAQTEALRSLNCKVDFAQRENLPSWLRIPGWYPGKIACRHMVMKWILERKNHFMNDFMAKLGQREQRVHHSAAENAAPGDMTFSYRHFRDAAAMKAHMLVDLEAQWAEANSVSPEAFCHVDRLGEALAEIFKSMKAGDKALFVLTSDRHAMALNLQVKEEETEFGKRLRYVRRFYDPNHGSTHIPVSTFDLEALKALTFESLYGGEDPAWQFADRKPDARRANHNLQITRVFDMPAHGIALRARPTLFLPAKGFEEADDYLAECIVAGLPEQVSQGIKNIFESWKGRFSEIDRRRAFRWIIPGPASWRARRALIKELRSQIGKSLRSAAFESRTAGVAACMNEVIAQARAAGVPAGKLLEKLLPKRLPLMIVRELKRSGHPGDAASMYDIVSPVMNLPATDFSVRAKVGYIQSRFDVFDRTAASRGLRKTTRFDGVRQPRAAMAVAGMLCAILESNMPDKDKAKVIRELGVSVETILQALHDIGPDPHALGVKPLPEREKQEWIARIRVTLTPAIVGRRTYARLIATFPALALGPAKIPTPMVALPARALMGG